jgi:hypothetical protein
MGSLIFGAGSITFARRCSTPSRSPCLQAGVAALTQQADCGMVPGDPARLALSDARHGPMRRGDELPPTHCSGRG